MASTSDFLSVAVTTLCKRKPPNSAAQGVKKAYSEQMSRVLASAFSNELKRCGARQVMPQGTKGGERRFIGGIGAKKVDVSWATEEAGLLLALSIKTINFPNFQKNLTNRRGDLLFESVTLHRRFPFAVLGGFLFLDVGATLDDTPRRRTTFDNAKDLLKRFDGRQNFSDPEEILEKLYIGVVDATQPRVDLFTLDERPAPIDADRAITDLLELVARRNSDRYRVEKGKIRSA